ncbi:unnamed protein product, partial [Oppiella nova]
FPNLSEMEKSEYTCSICHDIFCCPMTTPCCLQTLCEDCITGWLQNNTTCPYDRKSLSLDKLTRAPRVLANMLGNLSIKCDFWDKGCRKVVNLDDLIQHTAICEHNEANRPKTCDVCYCDKTRDHDCVDALLEAKCSANDEIDLLKRTVKELKSEKDQFLKTIQDIVARIGISAHRMTIYLTSTPQAISNQGQILMLDPMSELHFRGPFTVVVTSYLKLRNPCERRVCFKLKTTAPKRYCVRPNVGHIEAFGTVTIAVSLQPVDIDNLIGKNKHKFMVQTMFAPEGVVNQETLWEGVNPEAIMRSKLKCVFDVTPPSNETPVR